MDSKPKPQVLLIHGFTGTPHDLEPLAEQLKSRGMLVEVPALAGHGTSPNDLRAMTWRDWFDSARLALDRLNGDGPRIVVSLSMGTFIGTLLASQPRNQIRAVIFLSPAFSLTWPGRLATYLARLRLFYFFPFIRKRGGSDICDPKARARSRAYPEVPIASMLQFEILRRKAISTLSSLSCPVFLGFGQHDRTINIEKTQTILKKLGSHRQETHFFPNSGHVLPVDFDSPELNRKIIQFIESIE